MSAGPKPYLSGKNNLIKERAAEYRSEYFRGEMFAMAGATYEHTRIKGTVERQAGNSLESGPCVVLSSDMRVKVDSTGLYTYPDINVICEEPRF